jgi:phosphohistidine swiveling domain-containing protein
VWNGKVTKEKALASVSAEQLQVVQSPTFDAVSYKAALATAKLAVGLPASPGCAVGKVVTTAKEAVAAKQRGEQVILFRPDTCPDDLSGMMAAVAVVTKTGGYTSHAGVVARSMGKPCIVAASDLNVAAGAVISVDARAGVILNGSVKMAGPENKKEVNLFLKWAREASYRRWRTPQLVFRYYDERITASQMIADFYMIDAIYNAVKGKSLEAKAKTVRMRIHTAVAERVAMYLTVAVGGELRHARKAWPETRNELAVLVSEFDSMTDEPDSSKRRVAQARTLRTLTTLGTAEHIRYLALVVSVFNGGQWTRAYGGRKWGAIANAALGFLKGELPHSMFADHAFDLQHNNGSVFGKNDMIDVDRNVHDLLEVKKHATDIGELHRRLVKVDYGSYSSRSALVLDADVEALYNEGIKLGLWKDPQSLQRSRYNDYNGSSSWKPQW